MTVERWRTLGLLIFLIGAAGTTTELFLLGHNEDAYMWTPIVLFTVGLLAAIWVGLAPSRRSVTTLRAVAFSYLPAATAGLYFHINSNVEFELEMRPTMEGLELVKESMTGAIPALAPGAMAHIGLLGLLVCFRHPALNPTSHNGADQEM